MKIRACILATSLLLTATAGAALAAPKKKPAVKPVCQLIKDAAHDANYNGVPGDDNDDILSADLASNAKMITAVIRVGSIAAPNPVAPLGQGYFLRFNAKGSPNTLFLSARTYPTGTTYLYGYSADDPSTGINTSYTIGAAQGSVSQDTKQVRISAPNAGFAPAGTKLAKGTKLTGLTAETYRIVGQGLVPSQNVGPQRVPLGGFLLQFDEGGGSSYVVGTPSCVKP